MAEKLKKIINSNWFLLLFLFLVVYSIGHKSDLRYGWTNPDKRGFNVYSSDAFGYYSYLPQYLIYPGSPHYTYLDSLGQESPHLLKEEMVAYSPNYQHKINKFYIGTAFLQSPFFGTNHIVQSIFNGKTDGYSFSYQASVFIGAMFYLLLSMIGIVKLFELFNLNRFMSLIAIVLIFYGTNLSYYSTIDLMYSHLYSFFACTWFLYFIKKWILSERAVHLYAGTAFFSLIVIIRPADGLIFFIIPFLFDSFSELKTRIKAFFSVKNLKVIFFVLLIGLFFLFLQLGSNYYQTGAFGLYSYEEEGFRYLWSPQIMNVLFSYRKGFFVYTPVMLLLIPSWLILFRKKKYFGWGSLIVSFLFIWIISSWWYWSYGGCFGMRALIGFYPLFLLVLFIAMSFLSILGKCIFILLISIGIHLNQVFEYQYLNNIFHYDEMNKNFFWHVFLEKDARFSWYPYIEIERMPFKEKRKPDHSEHYFFDPKSKKWTQDKAYLSTSVIDDDYITSFRIKLEDSLALNAVRIRGQAMIQNANDLNDAFIFYKNKEQETDSMKMFIGNQIKELGRFEPFYIEYANPGTIGSDSLIIHFRALFGKRILKNVVVSIDKFDKY